MRASELEDVFITLLRLAVTDLPQDVVDGLEQALKSESNSTAKSQLEAILENIKLASQGSIPMCQDTGIQIFYLTVGSKFPLITEIPQILENAVRRGTQEIPLRPNTVNPLFHKNPGDNTGQFIPWINWKIVKGKESFELKLD